jgi:hypothetical protein
MRFAVEPSDLLTSRLIALLGATCSTTQRGHPLRVKGLSEIDVVGTAAAIANAIYHATGQRINSLPIRIDRSYEIQATVILGNLGRRNFNNINRST